MAHYTIAYVCPGPEDRDHSWVLGAIAGDGSTCAVEANPGFDAVAAAAATELEESSLRNWAQTMRHYIEHRHMTLLDETSGKYVPVQPPEERFLKGLIAESIGEWNYYYAKVQEMSGSAAEVAARVAGGVPSGAAS